MPRPTALALGIAVSVASLAVISPAAAPDGVQRADQTDVDALTIPQLAGQRAVYSYSGTTPPSSLLKLVRTGNVAGVIFFGENITSKSQIKRVVGQLNAAQRQSPIEEPLLLMTDQEGGEVRRLPGAPAMSEKQIGASANRVQLARNAGTAAGKNLRSVGMNVNLAPVLGVYRSPGDFLDQFERSYSTRASVVRQLGPNFIQAHQRTGVATTAKHFPGLGAATADQNTDEVPVTLNLSRQTLQNVDMRPYPTAIGSGTNLVMMSWAVYPALDSRPAGLSKRVIKGWLRNTFDFKGVAISDAMEAGALTRFGSIGNRSVLASSAGMDALLYSGRSVSEGNQGRSGLIKAMRAGTVSRSDARAAVTRILDLRRRIGAGGRLGGPGG